MSLFDVSVAELLYYFLSLGVVIFITDRLAYSKGFLKGYNAGIETKIKDKFEKDNSYCLKQDRNKCRHELEEMYHKGFRDGLAQGMLGADKGSVCCVASVTGTSE